MVFKSNIFKPAKNPMGMPEHNVSRTMSTQHPDNVNNPFFSDSPELAGEDEIKEVLEDWKKKKLSDSFQEILFNIILRKANIKALELEEELNLPFHINLPSIKKK